MERMEEEGRGLVTTDRVIGEAYTLIVSHLGVRSALAFLERVRSSLSTRRVFVPEDWELAAEELLAQYSDHAFSYVDAISFVTMRRLRIREAFAFDSDFVVAGFELFGEGS